MTAIVASGPPASATKRLRMTRSRTLSSAPPMMMTVPSATSILGLRRWFGERIPARLGVPADDVTARRRMREYPCDDRLGGADRSPARSRARPGVAGGSSSTSPTWSIADPAAGRRLPAGAPARGRRGCTIRGGSPRSLLLSLTFALVLAGLIARGEAGGADARAYWAGVRIWLNGGDPYHPTGPFLPYVYAPWMLPLFAPWALLPWDVAWFVWRGGTILLLLWTIHWAYRRRPLTTAVIVALLAFPFGANLDTGNINLQLTLMLWAAPVHRPAARRACCGRSRPG